MKLLKFNHHSADISDPGGSLFGGVVIAARSPEVRDHLREMRRIALRPGTIDKRQSVLARCELAIGHPLIGATTLELRGWLDQHQICSNTRYAYISHLAAFFRWAVADERATTNPTLRLTRPKLRKGLPRPLPAEVLALLIDQAPTAELRAMIVLGGYAGLRCMEIAGLDAADVLLHVVPPVIIVVDGKGGRARVIPISDVVVEALRVHGALSGPVFCKVDGRAVKPWRVSHMLRNHMLACGIAASAHQLRHAYATEVYRRSGDLLMVQNLLGHASPATTAGYTAWAQDRAASVVATLFT